MERSPFIIKGEIRNSVSIENSINELVKKVIYGDKENTAVLTDKSEEE